jgi:SAM-dependent methyltransferase
VVWEAGDLAGHSVLDVGCGTGSLTAELVARGAHVVGVDPSPEMLAEARQRLGPAVELTLGRAEGLPFDDGRFERLVLRLVVHLVDCGRALPELARVLAPAGRAVITTFEPEHFDRFWLNPYFPSIREIDRARFPEPQVLTAELREAGFEAVMAHRLSQRRSTTREEALERIGGRFISSLHLLSEEEFQSGLAAAERGLPARVEYGLEWAILVATKPA